MSSEPQDPTPEGARDPATGQILPGNTLNPGGKSKLVSAAVKELKRGSVAAAEYLNRVIAGKETTWAMTKAGPEEMPVPAKDRIAAALGVLKFTVPKKLDLSPTKAGGTMTELQREILAKLAGLDS